MTNAFQDVFSHHPHRFDTEPFENVSSLESIFKFIVHAYDCVKFKSIFKVYLISYKLFPVWAAKFRTFSLMVFRSEKLAIAEDFNSFTSFPNSVGNLIFRSSNFLTLAMKKLTNLRKKT